MTTEVLAADLTLSIVSHGHGRRIHDLLTDLNDQPSLRNVLVIVTLNLPEKPPEPSRYPNLHVVIVENVSAQGFGRNHNQAFKHCATQFFGILNPDLRLLEDPFPALLLKHRQDEKIGLVAPLVFSPNGAIEDSVRENLTPWSLWRRQFGKRSHRVHAGINALQSERFFWFAGMFLLVKSEAFREIGGFDERFRLYCEDYDLCARLTLAGRNLALVSETRVLHDAQRESRKSLKYLFWHLSSLTRVWRTATFWRIMQPARFRSGQGATSGGFSS